LWGGNRTAYRRPAGGDREPRPYAEPTAEALDNDDPDRAAEIANEAISQLRKALVVQ
jgi:hypothetical protein